jgi:hypothetical protein
VPDVHGKIGGTGDQDFIRDGVEIREWQLEEFLIELTNRLAAPDRLRSRRLKDRVLGDMGHNAVQIADPFGCHPRQIGLANPLCFRMSYRC